jgi:hypothetical protein
MPPGRGAARRGAIKPAILGAPDASGMAMSQNAAGFQYAVSGSLLARASLSAFCISGVKGMILFTQQTP